MSDLANKPKHPGGRPPKFTPEEINIIVADLDSYIRETDDPTISWFVSHYDKYDVVDQYIFDREEFSGLVKRAIKKQEAYLLRGATKNELNSTFSLFRLKQPQHGYKDRTETDITSKGKAIVPILGGLSVPSHHSDEEVGKTKQENQDSARGDVSQQDDLDTLIAN
jgi:hypothetical protein